METPEDRFYNPAKINAWFAVSAVLTLAVTVAVVLDDHYSREWKRWQTSFHELEKKRAEEILSLRTADPASLPEEARAIRNRLLRGDAAAAEGPSTLDDAAFGDALAAVKDSPSFPAGAVLAARDFEAEAAARLSPELLAKRGGIEAVRDRAESDRYKAEKQQRERQALVDELKFRMDHAVAHGHAVEAEEAEKEWTRAVAEEKEVHARMDAFALEKTDCIKEIAGHWAPIAGLQERARRLLELAGVTGAEKKMGSFIAGGLRDAPLLDFPAPVKRIDQKVFPDLTVDYNFALIGRVDRCITCHTGIDKVRVDPDTGAVTPVYTAENTPERVFRTHPRPETFVASVSKHSVDKMGCTVCHDGLGWGLTFADAYHTPSSEEQEKEWEEKYHWHRGESWDFPMLPQKHIEASCFKCHRDQAQLNPEDKFAKEIPGAPKWNRGLRVVERHGCFGCHKIDGYSVPGLDKWMGEIKDEDKRGYAMAVSMRKVGPSLRRVASKWNAKESAWKWIWHPQGLRPATNMPHFFDQPNNRGTDPLTGDDYDVRTRTEVWGLVEYLWSESEAWEGRTSRVRGDRERGKQLFAGADEDGKPLSVGCVGCHSTKDFPLEGVQPNDFGPELSTVGSKVSERWLYSWLKEPSEYWHGTRMPSLRLDDQEAADLAAYLASLRDEAWEKRTPPPVGDAAVRDFAVEAVRATARPREDPVAMVDAMTTGERLRAVGRRAITRYACFGCHDIKGFEDSERIGTELGGGEGWGSKDVDRLDFGLMEDPKAVETFKSWGSEVIPHRKPEWAYLKMRNPRVFDAGVTKQPHEKLVMPNFHFNDEDAESVVTVLLSLQRGEVPGTKRPLRDSRDILAEKMKWITRQYNCYGCHTITRQVVLDGQGKWIAKGKGGDIRPWLGEDADPWPPSLGGEAVRKKGEEAVVAAIPGQPVKPKGKPPVKPVLREEGNIGEGTRVQPAWLFRFLRDPGANVVRPYLKVRMPTFGFTQQELNGIVQGFAAEDAVPFPFEFKQGDPLTAREREEAREIYMTTLECFKCHPTPGAPKPGQPGPDIALTHDRLRHEWVRIWLENPDRVLWRTRMPANWPLEEDNTLAPRIPEKNVLHGFFDDDARKQVRKVTDWVFEQGAPKRE